MTNSRTRKKQLAKIYYQNREVKHINIKFDDLHHSIYIGPSTHISGKEAITMHLLQTEHDDDGRSGKGFTISLWELEDLDKVQINHRDSGIMFEWLSNPSREVKSSLFIPIVRVLYIKVDDPQDVDDELPQGIIDK